MRDEQDMRILEEHRAAFGAVVDDAIAKIMEAFRVLHCIEWSAPWRKGRC